MHVKAKLIFIVLAFYQLFSTRITESEAKELSFFGNKMHRAVSHIVVGFQLFLYTHMCVSLLFLSKMPWGEFFSSYSSSFRFVSPSFGIAFILILALFKSYRSEM